MKKRGFFNRQTAAVVFTLLFVSFHPVSDITCRFPAIAVAEAKDKDKDAISLNASSTSIIIDDSFNLRIYNTQAKQTIICKSSDSKVVSVKASEKDSSVFILKGKKCGTAEITIRVKDGLNTVDTLKCDVTVGLPATSVSFTRSKVKLTVGNRTSLKTILKPSDSVEEPTYVSSDTDIAYVSGKGTVIAKSVGECVVTAYIRKKDEKDKFICDSCRIIVTEEDLENNSEDT